MVKKEELDNKYWREYKDKTSMAGITLDELISKSDFEKYGNRLADRQIKMLALNSEKPIGDSSILDIGCGMGRVCKPYSLKFAKVTGVDMNAKILEAAREYTQDSSNIEFIKNDGVSLPFEDESFDFVYSGGVLQHIPNIDVITNYFCEGLRVLKTGGILNFSVQVWMILRKGGVQGDRVGAQIRSTDIELILNNLGHELIAIYYDDVDPVPNYNILIRKLDSTSSNDNIEVWKNKPYKINPNIVEIMMVRTGIFEDLETYTKFRSLWATKKSKRVTFFRQSIFDIFGYLFQAVWNKFKKTS